jgi:hypothetical protein
MSVPDRALGAVDRDVHHSLPCGADQARQDRELDATNQDEINPEGKRRMVRLPFGGDRLVTERAPTLVVTSQSRP